MKHKIIPILFTVTCLTGCMANTPVETTMEETTVEVSSETTIKPTEKETSETTIEETITTETTEHNPVLTLQQIEFNGVLPDGEYFAIVSSFDNDYSGATFGIRGYWRISEEEYNNLEIGDTIIIDETKYNWTENGINHPERIVYLEKLANGYYYIRGDEDSIYMYPITDSYHFSFAPDIEIWNGVCPYGQEQPFQPTIPDPIDNIEYTFRYKNIQEFARDLAANDNIRLGIHIVVENGVITKMYIDPECHDPWMTIEVRKKYHSR